MDYSYSSTSHTDSSSSASYSFSSTQFPHHQEIKSAGNQQPSFQPFRRYPTKAPIMKKLPIAPLPPTPPKVYKVNPVEFKDVVQKLTGAVEFQPRRLREVAPPPLSLSSPHRNNYSAGMDNSDAARRRAEDGVGKRQKTFDANFGAVSPLGFSLSPSSLAWCTAMLLSPGTIASFEPSLVLYYFLCPAE